MGRQKKLIETEGRQTEKQIETEGRQKMSVETEGIQRR